MEAPPVQYVTTSDGYNIAYCVSGEGLPFLLLPFPFNNLRLMWANRNRSLFEGLAARFRLVQYDSRGHGMSTRGLRDDHSVDDYLIDLEAVAERVGLTRFVLLGGPLFCHVAASYAERHPERVAALILHNATPGQAWEGFARRHEETVRESWDTFLFQFTSVWAVYDRQEAIKQYRETVNQQDFLKILAATRKSPDLETTLRSVRAPTLVITSADVPGALDGGRILAAATPDARLVSVERFGEDLYTYDGSVPRVVELVTDFLASLPTLVVHPEAAGVPAALPDGLTGREAEVLRLVAAGKSNAQIADELVISQNTVIRHVSNIFGKIGVANRAEAASYATRNGIV